jgi:hypothetical protein
MARLLPSGVEVLPQQTPALVLSRRGCEGSRLMPCRLGMWPCALEAQGGQEGRGQADQRPVGHGRPGGAMLVMTEPQPRLAVLQPRLHGPARVVRPDDGRGGASVPRPRIFVAVPVRE